MKALLWLFALLSTITVAADVQNSSNFLELGITKMDYKKPAADAGEEAGKLQFTEVTLSRSDMTINFRNSNNAFDADIIWRKNFLRFQAPNMNLDFNLYGEGGLNDTNLIKTNDTLAVINPSFFTFGGKDFEVDQAGNQFKFENFFIFCSANNPEVDMATADGITLGCLTESHVNVKFTNSPMKLYYGKDYEDGDRMDFYAELGTLSIMDARDITLDATKTLMKVSDYKIYSNDLLLECKKDETLFELDTEKIQKDCENSLKLSSPAVVMENEKEHTKFYMGIENLEVANEEVSFNAPAIQFVDRESSVTVFDLDVNCQKKDEAIVYDLHSVVDQCLQRGEITIDRLVSHDDESKLYWQYDRILSSGYNPLKGIKKKEKDAKDVRFKLDGHTFSVEASAYKKTLVGYLKFNVFASGDVMHYPEKDQIVLKVKDIRVPIGWVKIKWKGFLMKFVKKALVGESIFVNGDLITIQL